MHGLEEVRLANRQLGRTYEEQLELEIDAEFGSLIRRLTALIQPQSPVAPEDYLRLLEFGRYLVVWDREGGNPTGIRGLLTFFTSGFWREMPLVKIRSQLFARLVTDDVPIKPGDWMDVEQLAAVIPYCDWVITDRRMQYIVTELGIDKEYGTTVVSIRDVDLLTESLRKKGLHHSIPSTPNSTDSSRPCST